MRLLAEMPIRQFRLLLSILRYPVHRLQGWLLLGPVVDDIGRKVELLGPNEGLGVKMRHRLRLKY
jgi:hypothetical protein